MSASIGVDIGGTKISAGVVDAGGRVLDRERRATPGTDVTATEDAIVDVVTALSARNEVCAVGVGAAGWIGTDRATVLFSPHLAWRDEPLRDALAARIAVPVLVENDGNAAAWAEYRFGVARSRPVVVCVTLGTGIGGGMVLDGAVYRGAHGIACEWGHMSVVPGGRQCACGNRGCWEMYASGRALALDARELVVESPATGVRLIELGGGVDAITGPVVTAAASGGDPAAVAICTAAGRWLGRGLADLAAALDPSIFVVGGGVSEAGELLLGPAREEFAQTLAGRGFRPLPPIVAAALGPDAGLIGAADLARRAAASGEGGPGGRATLP